MSKNFKILNKILDLHKIKKGDKLYLGIDLMYLSLASKVPRGKMEEFSLCILNLILKKIGKKGSLIIPVFDEDSVKRKFFDRKRSVGQTGIFGNYLLKKKFKNRTLHPLNSFLFFGRDEKKILNLEYINSEGEDSIWPYLIINKFKIFTIGYHYALSSTIIHYLERKAKVNYRFDKKFKIKYKNINGKVSNKFFYFFARKLDICDYSSITKKCDKLLKSKKIYKFHKYKNIITFTVKISEFTKLILIDLKKGSKTLVDYVGKKRIHNKLLFGEALINLENKLKEE